MKYFVILLQLLLFLPLSASAQKLIPIENYGNLPANSMFALSPNGEMIAYRMTKQGKDFYLVYNIKTNKRIKFVNIDSVKPLSAYFLSNTHIIFSASNYIKLEGYKGRYHVNIAYSFNIDSGKIRQLMLPGKGTYLGQTNLTKIDGIASSSKNIYMPAYMQAEGNPPLGLMRVKLDSKLKPKVFERGTPDTIEFFVDDDDNVMARERYSDRTNKHRIEVQVDEEWIEIFSEISEIRTKTFIGVTPDFKSLVFTAYADKTSLLSYYTMALADGKISQSLLNEKNKDINSTFKSNQKVVYGDMYDGFRPSYEFFDEKINKRFKLISKALTDYSVSIISHTPQWKSILLYIEGGDSNGDYFLVDENNDFTFIVSARPDIPAELFNPVIETSYKARDGLQIPVLLTVPVTMQKQIKNLPAIMMPHGGPESYDHYGFDFMAQFFANRGYLVIQPQFRGSSGFGLDFKLKGRGEWGKKMQDDLTDAVQHYSKQGTINGNEVCIVGWSYGGYAALAGGAFSPELYNCVVAIAGVSDLEQMLTDERKQHGKNSWVLTYWKKVIESDTNYESKLKNISPINYANNFTAPVLLIHGENDDVVPFAQSEDMYSQLKTAKKNVTLIELEDDDHSLSSSNNRLHALKEIEKFVFKYIKK
jgi:dipeptidyl aminopeptidase/acylaminoacyl peptidase